ncbi:MAG TPA: hypothetical protein VFZ91_06260 [Allosphingosinicella sp.]
MGTPRPIDLPFAAIREIRAGEPRPSPAPPQAPPAQRLTQALRRLLGESMGGEPWRASGSSARRPLVQTVRLIACYGLLWAAAEALTWAAGLRSHPQLVSLFAWTGGLMAARALIARGATARLMDTIERDIVPYATPAYLDAVAGDVERRCTAGRRVGLPLAVATACAIAACLAFGRELGGRSILASPQVLFGVAAAFAGFFLSARSGGAAAFYRAFAERLDSEPSDAFFVLGAADSPLVQGLSKLGSQVLVFWVLIFVAILSSMLLALPWLGEYRLPEDSIFLLIFVPVAGFISLGIGSLVYLRSEARIRASLRRFTQSEAAVLQRRIGALLDPLAGRLPDDGAELARLTAWHDRILAGGRYGSRAGTAVSIALPLLLPALSFVRSVAETWLSKAA